MRPPARTLVAVAATVLAVAVAPAGLLGSQAASASAPADPVDACTSTHGAVVAVDFGHWGGPVARGCDPDPTTGMNLLHNGGFDTTGTGHDGPGFVCRIGSPDFDGGTERPTPAEDPCTLTPPITAYWSYWIAPAGQDSWTYSPLGALADVPADGEVEAWTFGATDAAGTTGQPPFAPDSVRAGGTAPPSIPPTPPPPAPAGPGADLAAATGYLTGQLTDGDHVFDATFGSTDYVRTAQVGVALAATGGDDAALADILAYLAAHVSEATHPDGPDAPPDPAATSGIALLVEITGGDPRDVGGQDLVAALAGHVCTGPGSLGNCTAAGDFFGAFTPVTQATGVLALARAGAVPVAAVDRLTRMQCAGGGFPGSMISPGDFCDPENDVTGLVVQALTAAGGAGDAVGRAGAALVAAQRADGGFPPFTGAADSDTASTALDAEALRGLGQDDPAARADAFVAARQQADGGFAFDPDTPGSDPYPTVNAVPALAGATLATLTHPVGTGAPTPPTGPAPVAGPDLGRGSAYLVDPANLLGGHYYQAFPGFADYGLTIDGAFALAATGAQDAALRGIVAFLDGAGADASGHTVNDWTGVGTPFASGGSLGKEALLAEVVGADPRDFGGHDLIAALDAAVCQAASTGGDRSCVAAGNYTFATSTFSQALGVMAQLRAGDGAHAQGPVGYLESLRHADGSFPSLLPDSGDGDVDSTAMAVMALALVPGDTAADAVDAGLAWIAGRQEPDGGFPGVAGDSVNSAALAIQGLTLRADQNRARIDAGLEFLAGQQNGDGGFNVAAGGQRGSDLRASTQALSGAVGTSFGTLSRDLGETPVPPESPPAPPTQSPPAPPTQSPPAPPTHAPPTRAPTRHPTHASTPAPARTFSPGRTGTGPGGPAQHPARSALTGPATGVPAAPTPAGSTGTAPAPAVPLPAPTGIPVPPAGSGQPPAPAPSVAPTPALADASGQVVVDLWWTVLVVAILAAAVIAGLFLRRRRLYPAPAGGSGTGSGTGSGGGSAPGGADADTVGEAGS